MRTLILLLTVFFLANARAASKNKTSAEILAGAKVEDWRAVAPENTLYMELPAGRVVIELAPEFAPNTVANIKTLAREKFWDGLFIVRAQDNYVVQWGDPDAEKPEKKRRAKGVKDTLVPEFDHAMASTIPFTALPDKDVYAKETGFSRGFAAGRDAGAKKTWLIHCYSAVGVGRDVAADSGNGAELYAVIGNAPRHLDRNVTIVGRVLHGMELLSTLPRGRGALGFYEKPEERIPIKSIRVAADVPEKERVALEVLRTDTRLFKELVSARRHRQEEWFHFQAGHVDACNMNVPVRVKN